MNRRLRLLIILLPLVVIAVLVFGFLSLRGGDDTVSDPRSNKVIITNAYTYKLETSGLESIQKSLYDQVIKHSDVPEDSYTGNIRTRTFKTTQSQFGEGTTALQVPTVSFIVDIPQAQQSYIVSKSGGSEYPYDVLHITCPGKDQLVYGDFGCVNEEQ